jgi:hypothetical protein
MAEETVVAVDDVFAAMNETVVEESISSTNSHQDIEDDEVLSLAIDQEELAKLESELYLPSGVYVWDKTPGIRRNYSEKDIAPSDMMQVMYKATGDIKYNKGRCIINVSGIVVNQQTLKKGRFSFGFSPDYRTFSNKETGAVSDEADMLSKTYAGLTTFYFSKEEKKVKNVKDILNMLEEGVYSMYITLSKAGNANYLGRLQRL